MRNSNRPFIPVNDYNEMKFTIIVRWIEWPVRFAHNYTDSFRSILRVLLPFSCWEFIHVFPHTALFNPPDFPRLFEPVTISSYAKRYCILHLYMFRKFNVINNTSMLDNDYYYMNVSWCTKYYTKFYQLFLGILVIINILNVNSVISSAQS